MREIIPEPTRGYLIVTRRDIENSEVNLSRITPLGELLKNAKFAECFLLRLRLQMLMIIFPYLNEDRFDYILSKSVSTKAREKRLKEGKEPIVPEFKRDEQFEKKIGVVKKKYLEMEGLDFSGLEEFDKNKHHGSIFKKIIIPILIKETLEEDFRIIEKDEEFGGHA